MYLSNRFLHSKASFDSCAFKPHYQIPLWALPLLAVTTALMRLYFLLSFTRTPMSCYHVAKFLPLQTLLFFLLPHSKLHFFRGFMVSNSDISAKTSITFYSRNHTLKILLPSVPQLLLASLIFYYTLIYRSPCMASSGEFGLTVTCSLRNPR